MADVRSFEVILKGNSKSLLRAFKRAQSGTDRFKATVQRAAKIGAAAVAALGLALGTAAIQGAVKLETGLREVQTLLPELTDKGFGQMREEVLSLSNEMGIATDKAVPALYSAISAGVPPDNVMAFLETASKTAIGGVTSLETATDALTTVLNTWGKTAGVTAKQASDVLFTSVKLGKTTMEELGGSINQVAGLASAFGIEFEQVAAGFTEVTKAGVPTAEAMTKMRSLIQAIASPSARAAGAFKKLGIEVSSARVAQEGILPVTQEIIDKTAGNDVMLRKLFGSVEALQAALVLTTGSGEDYNATLDAMRNATGAADQAFATMNDTVGRKWKKTQVQFKNALTEIGTDLLPVLAEALEDLLPLLDALKPFFQGLGLVLQFLGEAVAGVTGTLRIMADKGSGAVEELGSRTRTSFGHITHDVEQLELVVARNIGDRVPHHLEAGARAAEDLESRTRTSLAGVWQATHTAEQQLADATVAASADFRALQGDITAASRGLRQSVTSDFRATATEMVESTVWSADEQRQAIESHYRDMDRLYNAHAAARLRRKQLLEDAVFRIDADAARRQFIFASQGLSAAQRFLYDWEQANFETHTRIEQTTSASSRRTADNVLSDADRLAGGLRTTMTDACGSVTGFQKCVDGLVVEYDADMRRVQTDADRLAGGLRTTMTDACGSVTGFQKCVDGLVVEFDADMRRVLSDADRLESGMLVTMTNACGTVTGFRQCVDGMVVEFDENMNRIVSAADRMAEGVGSAAAKAVGPLGQGLEQIGGGISTGLGLGDLRWQDTMRHMVGGELLSIEDSLRREIAGGGQTTGRRAQTLLDSLPQMAEGGIVRRPTLVLAGERGPEAIIPLGRSGTHARTVNLNVALTVEGSVISAGDLGDVIVEEVQLAADRGELRFGND